MSGWDKVFASTARSPKSAASHHIRSSQVYDMEHLCIIFHDSPDEGYRVCIETLDADVRLHFSNFEFEEFISTFDSLSNYWPVLNIMIGSYNLIYHRSGEKRSLKFEDKNTDDYLFRWTEKHITEFSQHISELYKLNSNWY